MFNFHLHIHTTEQDIKPERKQQVRYITDDMSDDEVWEICQQDGPICLVDSLPDKYRKDRDK